jgi:hypothetical protein
MGEYPTQPIDMSGEFAQQDMVDQMLWQSLAIPTEVQNAGDYCLIEDDLRERLAGAITPLERYCVATQLTELQIGHPEYLDIAVQLRLNRLQAVLHRAQYKIA